MIKEIRASPRRHQTRDTGPQHPHRLVLGEDGGKGEARGHRDREWEEEQRLIREERKRDRETVKWFFKGGEDASDSESEEEEEDC